MESANDLVKELNRHTLRVDVTKEDGSAEVPAKVTWRIDSIHGVVATEVMANTDFIPSAAVFELVIPAALNRITIAGVDVELRRVTVIADGLAAAEYTYRIKRLKGLPNA